MVDHRENDGVFRKAVDSLRELPPLDTGAVSRIVTAAARLREIDAEPHSDDLLPAPRPRMVRWPAVAGIAAAAALAGYLFGGRREDSSIVRALERQSTPSVSEAPVPGTEQAPRVISTPPAASPAVALGPDAMAVPTQFVFDGRGAARVMLVGDFNGWDERAAPLVREMGSSLWSITVPLQPGRHVYAFLVDSVWTVDPHAPSTRDPDFGVTGSVVIVGKP